jgi:hypothetical protein
MSVITVSPDSGQRLRVGKQVVAHPGHGQIGEDLVARAQAVELAAAAGGDDQR